MIELRNEKEKKMGPSVAIGSQEVIHVDPGLHLQEIEFGHLNLNPIALY
jgi:hypothetical protein